MAKIDIKFAIKTIIDKVFIKIVIINEINIYIKIVLIKQDIIII